MSSHIHYQASVFYSSEIVDDGTDGFIGLAPARDDYKEFEEQSILYEL